MDIFIYLILPIFIGYYIAQFISRLNQYFILENNEPYVLCVTAYFIKIINKKLNNVHIIIQIPIKLLMVMLVYGLFFGAWLFEYIRVKIMHIEYPQN